MEAKTGIAKLTGRPLAMMIAILKVLGRMVSISSFGRTNEQSQQAKYAAKNVSSFNLSLTLSLENIDSSTEDHVLCGPQMDWK